jgi:hypothetical protein
VTLDVVWLGLDNAPHPSTNRTAELDLEPYHPLHWREVYLL